MEKDINRREFLQQTAAAGLLSLGSPHILAFAANPAKTESASPVWQRTNVKVACLYMAHSSDTPSWGGLWPKPDLDLKKEIDFYKSEFAKLRDQIADVDFVVNQLVTHPSQVQQLREKLQTVDGILVIHLNLGIMPILEEILKLSQPTMVFAVPYSGHEWVEFGKLRKQQLGGKMDCLLTSDYSQLALAIKPFRAIRHLKDSKILDLSTYLPVDYTKAIKDKFGTEIKQIELNRMLDIYNSIDDKLAKKEADLWIKKAEKVIEPSKDEIFKSCKLALAFEKMLRQQKANVMTVDCYGSMYHKLPAFPCIGETRLNDMGLGGICESDLPCAITHLIFQGLTGRPSFISDPTMDVSKNAIYLAHCLGSTRMDGPDKPPASYKLRSIAERQEGAVPQVKMPYFTGEIVDAPVDIRFDRGCRTKILVKIDGDAGKLWQNWRGDLHRQTCYGDVTKELGYFSRFKGIKMVNEAI
jgi:hypothetical protein